MGKGSSIMQMEIWFEQLPLWLFYVMTVFIVFFSIIVGFRIGSNFRKRKTGASEAPVGTIVGAMLGLLAFILAFTFGMAASRFDARKHLLLDEVNAIGTAFLRADFLPAPQRAEARILLKKYVDLRTGVIGRHESLRQALAESEILHTKLWSQVADLPKQSGDSVLLGLYIQSLNEVIDLHSNRVTVGTQYRIPGFFWLALYFVTILTMAMVGYDFGITDRSVFPVSLILALAFSAVILLIEDLDRPMEGLLKVNQKPMLELQQKLVQSVK